MEIDINKITLELQGILQRRAPVRTNPISGPSGASPYPGNLKLNGINAVFISKKQSKIVIGGPAAPYGPYTETRAYPHNRGWMAKSVDEFVNLIITQYGGVIKNG